MSYGKRDRKLPHSFLYSGDASDLGINPDQLLSTFTDQETYQQMCSIFLQILKETNLDPV